MLRRLERLDQRQLLLIGGVAVAVALFGGAGAVVVQRRKQATTGTGRNNPVPPVGLDNPDQPIAVSPGQPLPNPTLPANPKPKPDPGGLPPLPSNIEKVPTAFVGKASPPRDQAQFITWAADYAKYVQRRSGLPPSVTIAMALEARGNVLSNNYFGLTDQKAPRFRFWDGATAGSSLVYPHPWYAFMHFAEYVYQSGRFTHALNQLFVSRNVEPYAFALASVLKGGGITNPYGKKITDLIAALGLKAYDDDQPLSSWWVDKTIIGPLYTGRWSLKGARFG